MFGSLRKKLKSGVRKLSQKADSELTVEQEEQFTHEPAQEPEEVLREEPDRLEDEQEKEEHFEAEEERTDLGTTEPELEDSLKEREIPEEKPPPEEKILKKEESLEKRGFLKRLKGVPVKVVEKELSSQDIDNFISEIESDLLSNNVALEVIEHFKKSLKQNLVEKKIRRGQTESLVRQAFESSLKEILNQETLDLEEVIAAAKKEKRPALLLFLGFNGSENTTTISKIASRLKSRGLGVVMAAADTYRAASMEQLEHHGKKLGVKVIKNKYGSDPAAVVFDAVKHASSKGLDVVLADTAGRTHINKNLIDELKKIIRVNSTDLKILVLDSLTGNDIIPQAQKFDEAAGVDALILTKTDVNEKGGAVLSAAFVTKKPVLFLGTGQGYADLQVYKPENLAKQLLE